MSHVAQWKDPPKGKKWRKGTGMGVKPQLLNACTTEGGKVEEAQGQ
jgi:hypothetical protein